MEEGDLYKVLDLQSPFRWRPTIREENRHEFDLEQEDVGTFSFFNFCVRIVQVYNECMNKNKTRAAELLSEVEEKLIGQNCEDELYVKSKDALYHVLFACKTLMAIYDGKNDDEVAEWLANIKKLDDMTACNKAAILAIKAHAHSLYSNDGLDTSLSLINMALSNDKITPYWSFLKGTFLQKQRMLNDVPSLPEKEAFEYAYKEDNTNPLFMVYFADTLRETCKYSAKRQKSYLWFVAKSAQVNVENEINKKYETALELYRKGYELKPNCPVIAFKSANGLMRLPTKFQDVKLVKNIISDCEKKFPNSGFGNLVCALYHERINKKIALSQRCLDKCVELNVFNGCINSIRLDFKEKKDNACIIERLEKMLEVFQEASRQEIIISQIISYYVFVTANIEKACDYMLKYYKKGTSGRHLEMHQSCFEITDGPVSLVDVITDQVKLKLRDHKLPKETRRFYNDFVRQMSLHNVDVLKGSPKNLLEQIQKSAVPKDKNPNKAHSNEAQRNSEPRTERFQSNDRARYTSRKEGVAERRSAAENVPSRDGSVAGRNRNASAENVSRNEAGVRRRDDRRPENRRTDYRPASFANERPKMASKFKEKMLPLSSSQPTSSSSRSADVKKEAAKPSNSNDDYNAFVRMGKNRVEDDAIIEKCKQLSLGDSHKDRSEKKVRRMVPEEYDRQQANGMVDEFRDVALVKERSRRSEDRSADESSHRRRDRSVSAGSDRSRKHKHRHRKHKKKHRCSESEDDDSRKRRRSPANGVVDEFRDAALVKERSRRSEDRSADESSHRRRDRSVSAGSDRSRKHKHRHRQHKKKHRCSESEDDDSRKRRRSPSPSRRHRRRSNDGHSRKSYRKHRSSESASDSERSTDRKREKEKRSHRSKKKHSSAERHHEKRRSHRDHEKSEKSSRRNKKESKKRYSDSEADDSR